MINGKFVLAVIPARGGSKGLPRKNILPLSGKPLIVWSIEAAKKSKYIDSCIVSTDDNVIAKVAESHGCEIPFIRPKHLARDKSATMDVILHALNFFSNKSIKYDYIVLLEPTSPLRDSDDIDIALNKLDKNRKKADSIVGVSRVESAHPVFDVKINKDGLIEPYIGKTFNVLRRQDIEELYFFEGSVYISDVEVLIRKGSFYHDRTMPYIVPRWKSLEIDEMVDLITAEAIISNLSLLEKGGAHD